MPLLPLVALLQATVAATPRDLGPLLRPILDRAGIPALGAAIVTSNGIEAIGALGRRSWTDTVSVSITDRWHIGSCTKAMTATLVARLIERRLLDWTTTVGDVFGSALPDLHPAWRRVPIEWLLTHRSGAAMNFPDEPWERIVREGGPPMEQRRRLVTETLRLPPASEPNTTTLYSNAGVIIAGAMLEKLAREDWETLMRSHVFGPLGMTTSGFGAPGDPAHLDQPRGHRKGSDTWQPIAPGPGADNPAAAGPTGTVHTTLGDWARFVAAHLRGERGDRSFLPAAAWRKLHVVGGKDWIYSPGWVMTRQPWSGGPLLRHLGSNQFWVAEASIALKRDVAILIVSNLADDAVEKPFGEVLSALVAEHDRKRRPRSEP